MNPRDFINFLNIFLKNGYKLRLKIYSQSQQRTIVEITTYTDRISVVNEGIIIENEESKMLLNKEGVSVLNGDNSVIENVNVELLSISIDVYHKIRMYLVMP